ncbi:hypothetical protein D3C80_2112890 [compost metagenome]
MALGGQADPLQQCLGPLQGFGAAFAQDLDRRLDEVFQHGTVGPEVEALEHHAEP